jgi:uncharacterized protein YegL
MDRRLGQGFDERVPLVLVLDTSDSMARPAESPRITELNSALAAWLEDARARPSLRSRVEIAIVTFSSAVQVLDPSTGGHGEPSAATAFAPIGDVADPVLATGGFTLMLPAIELAVDLAVQRRRLLAQQHVPSRRPRIWLLTDGAASNADGQPLQPGDLAETARLLRAAESPSEPSEGCLFYAIGVGDADRATLEVLAPDSTMMLKGLRFRDILGLVSDSSEAVHSSDEPGQAYRQAHDNVTLFDRIRSLEERYLDE